HDLRQGRLDGAHDAHLVDLDHALEVLARHRPERGHAAHDAGVRDDDVEAAEALDGDGHRALHRAAVGHVGGEADRAAVVQLGGGSAGGLLIQVDHCDRSAPGDQRARSLEADAACGARDERDLPAQLVASHARSLSGQRRLKRACRSRRSGSCSGPGGSSSGSCLRRPYAARTRKPATSSAYTAATHQWPFRAEAITTASERTAALSAKATFAVIGAEGRPQPVGTSNTRVPQSRLPSTVWLAAGGTYSVAIHTAFAFGERIAHE